MKKFYFYLVMLFCVAMTSLTSCRPEEWEMQDPSGSSVYGSLAQGKPVKPDTIMIGDSIVYVHDTINGDPIVVKDSIFITVRDTITVIVHDTIEVPGEEPEVVTLEYVLGSNKTDNGSNYTDIQPTVLKAKKAESGSAEVVLNTDVNRSAEISNNSDTLFVAKVAELQSTVSRPSTRSSYDVRGEYDINTGYRDYTVTLNDGSEYQVSTEAESASGMYEGEKRDLLYRMVQGVKVVSVDDELTNDTVVKGTKIYRKANRTMKVEVESLNRPLMGPEIVTLDTLTIASVAASKTNGIAVVYVEDGDVPEDTIPGVLPDTVPVLPDTVPVIPDTVPVNPDTIPDVPQPGYEYNGEKVESIDFSYAIDPNAGILREVLLVRFTSYVMPVVSKKMKTPVSVDNPNNYNSVVWYSNGWNPAYLAIHEEGFVWRLNGPEGSVAESATDETINWLASASSISKISRGDFLKHATFVNEGNTTRVYVDNSYYMTLE